MDYEDRDITIQDLYPDLSPKEQQEAEYRLLKYLAIVRRIWDRYEQEGKLDELIARIKKHRKSND